MVSASIISSREDRGVVFCTDRFTFRRSWGTIVTVDQVKFGKDSSVSLLYEQQNEKATLFIHEEVEAEIQAYRAEKRSGKLEDANSA